MAVKLIAENRKARHDYHLLERYEAGVVLTGTEVKSLRDGRRVAPAGVRGRPRRRGLADRRAHRRVRPGQRAQPRDRPDRKLLLHRREIESLYGKIREKGLTLVPTRLYFKDGKVKVEVALARGKERRDKRRDHAKRDADRQIERALKSRSSRSSA